MTAAAARRGTGSPACITGPDGTAPPRVPPVPAASAAAHPACRRRRRRRRFPCPPPIAAAQPRLAVAVRGVALAARDAEPDGPAPRCSFPCVLPRRRWGRRCSGGEIKLNIHSLCFLVWRPGTRAGSRCLGGGRSGPSSRVGGGGASWLGGGGRGGPAGWAEEVGAARPAGRRREKLPGRQGGG